MAKILLSVIVILALACFAAQNPGLVSVRFLLWQSSATPLAFLIILSAGVGALLALIASVPIHHRRGRELAKHRRELDEIRDREHA